MNIITINMNPIVMMKKRIRIRRSNLLLISVMILSACSTSVATSPQGGAFGPRTPTSSSTPTAIVTPTATPEVDACLFGKWLVDADSLGAYLLANITSDPAAQFSVIQVSGELFLNFNKDFQMSLDSKSYILILEIDSPDSSFNLTVLRLSMSASGTARFAVYAGTLISFNQDYELEDGNKIPINLSPTNLTLAPISLTPDNFFSIPWAPDSESDFLPPGDFPRSTPYLCEEGLLTLGYDTPIPVSFTRSSE
jgi:hypothetical protein